MPASESVVPHSVFQNQNLNEMGGSHSFLRRISGMITPECMSRIGDHLYAATKRRALGSILRGTVKAQNIDGYCEIYDKMLIVEPKAEEKFFTASCSQCCHFYMQRCMQTLSAATFICRREV